MAKKIEDVAVAESLVVTPSGLLDGEVNVLYTDTVGVVGGVGPYTYKVTEGKLPDGLTLSGETVSGTPTKDGDFTFTITATDSKGSTGARTYDVFIDPVPVPMEGLTPGRIVHFVLPNGEIRPAIVVRVIDVFKGLCRLQVFLDMPNDMPFYDRRKEYLPIAYAEVPAAGTWHWIPKA